MAGFIRRYLFDPGLEELLAIEGAVIIDREPPASITGVGTGTVLMVGEFEDGCFEECVEVFSGADLVNSFGGFGYTYGGVQANNPSARVRRADNATIDEYWNGNGWLALVNKRFRRLVICRVDTTIGEVEFVRLASVNGNGNFNWDVEPGWWLEIDLDRNAATATRAELDSVAGTSPQTLVAPEQVTITLDTSTPYERTLIVPFAAGSVTQADFIAAINAQAGDVIAFNQGAGVTRIVGRALGSSGNVTITAIGATLSTLSGYSAYDGDVGTGTSPYWPTFNAAAATVDTSAGSYPASPGGGETMEISVDVGTEIGVGPVTVTFLSSDTTQTAIIDRINTAIGFTLAQDAGGGVTRFTARMRGTDSNFTISAINPTIATALGIGLTSIAGTGNVANVDQVELTDVQSVLTTYTAGAILADRDEQNRIRLINASTAGVVRTIEVTGGTAVNAFGLTLGVEGDAFNGDATTIPAGSRVSNGSTEWVVARTVAVTETNPGPYVARVRLATDGIGGPSAGPGTVDQTPGPIGINAWSVNNPQPILPPLTEAQIDAAYVDAIEATLNPNTVAKEVNIVVAARQSNAIRQKLRENAITASASGLFGRMAVISPPLKTTRLAARSTVSQPGVGAYRDQRVVYAYPGVQTFVSAIAARGTAGGTGFTADGLIDVHFDAWVAAAMSQLPPEENPGQTTPFMVLVTGIEAGNTDVQDLREADYRAFKRVGIAAIRIANGVPIIQSGKTSVDPLVNPNLQNIARRRMADFIQDTLAIRLNSYSKKLATRTRRAGIVGEIDAFMIGLQSPNNEASQRIDSYNLDAISGNTPETIAAGIFRVILKCRTLPSLDVIVIDTTIGENVITVQAA